MKKTFEIVNGYLLEKLRPSGMFRVTKEALNKKVVVINRKTALKIAHNN